MRVKQRKPRETGRDYALRMLKENIIHLDLAPGSVVSENELAAELGLSRTPVREALIELSKVHIVEIMPQRGSRIALIDDRLVQQALFLRETLEKEIVALCCRRVTPAQLSELEAIIFRQEQYQDDDTSAEDKHFIELDNLFHQKLFEIADKSLIYSIIQDVVIHFDRVRTLTIDYMRPSVITEQHRKIFEAIKSGSITSATELTQQHLGKFLGIEKELQEKYPMYFVSESTAA